MTKSRHLRRSIGVRDVARWWPLIVVVTLIAVGGTLISHSRQAPSYTATTRIVVVPLAQWDDTFLGTALVRDSGDATRTAATFAAELNSSHSARVTADYLGGGMTPESVADSVKASVFEETNVIEVTARSTDPDKAAKLAEGFAAATLSDRWRTISAQLDARIASIGKSPLLNPPAEVDTGSANPTAAAELATLQTLRAVRDSGSDPTLRVEATSPAVVAKQLPAVVMVGLAILGGLLVGSLAAAGMALLRPAGRFAEERAAGERRRGRRAEAAAPMRGADDIAPAEEIRR